MRIEIKIPKGWRKVRRGAEKRLGDCFDNQETGKWEKVRPGNIAWLNDADYGVLFIRKITKKGRGK